jgi:hypothetical protein
LLAVRRLSWREFLGGLGYSVAWPVVRDNGRAIEGRIAQYIQKFRRDNSEAGGYAVSLDQPMWDKRSWHDVLPGSAA